MKIQPLIGAAAVVLVGATIAAWWFVGQSPVAGVAPEQQPGTVASVQPVDFNLVDMNGQTVTLATYRGKWLLIYFGFTFCPDMCPTTLQNLAATVQAMGDKAAQVQPIFITVDPERDTPQVLKDYVRHFGDRLIGLSGSPQQIAAAAEAFGAYYRKRETPGEPYTMDHINAIYWLTPEGVIDGVHWLDHEPDPAALAKKLVAAMQEKGKGNGP